MRQELNNDSLLVTSRGGQEVGEFVKKNSLGIIRARVSKGLYSSVEMIGHVLSRTPEEIRLGHCLGYVRDRWDIAKKQVWEIVVIPTKRLISEH